MLLKELVGSELIAKHRKAIKELITRLAGLPLALKVAGALIARTQNRGHSVKKIVEQLRERTELLLTEPLPADVKQFLQDAENPNVVAILQLNTEDLDEKALECFASIGSVTPNGAQFWLSRMSAGWGLDIPETRAMADRLVEAGLIVPTQVIDDEQFYYMHDLLLQHAKTMVEK